MEKIHVTVRARPLSQEDAKTCPWQISGNSIFFSNNSIKFDFDQVLGEDCKNVEVYQSRTKKIVSTAVRGFNGTVFAYGQTNSGKTYTMRGSSLEPGVIPLAVRDMFKTVQEIARLAVQIGTKENLSKHAVLRILQDIDREFLLRMSYMEIYNEEINDLLAPENRKLQIHESLERGIYVAGLREEIVVSPEQVLDLMEFGESHRHIGETNMNLHSSRSHTIFRMIIESRDRSEDDSAGSSCDAVRVSVLNLVDLAGSERAAKTGAEGVRLKEGSHINKSLMTLGTVIKKLSEGAESQGGHVPYRDSKLTRILQPALGGNANTAIICNITLAQIHMDETKSSLQFASRALRVTNCACVNEILTDAALLKRQKKEIEQLRAKLQDSHSEHFEEEILNLRNKLLQTELERIAMELEEEKKAQAEKERKLQEQAQKIKNLSSMVLNSNRDDDRDHQKKEKRRDTWCPGNLLRGIPNEDVPTTQSKATALKSTRPKQPLVPFEELEDEAPATIDHSLKQKEAYSSGNKGLENCTRPVPHALLNVTNRRKGTVKMKSLVLDNKELVDIQAEVEYEELLLTLETERTISLVKVDCLLQNLAEANLPSKDCNLTSRDTEAMLTIKRLEEQIRVLGFEKSSSQQNLELATEQTICGRDKYEEVLEDLVNAQKESKMASEQLVIYKKVDGEHVESLNRLLRDVQEIFSEFQGSKDEFKDVSSLVHELLECFSVSVKTFSEFRSLMSQSTIQLRSTISNYEKVHHCLKHKVTELEDEKLCLHTHSADLNKQIEELKLRAENSENAFNKLVDQHDLEKSELLSHFQILEKEISTLSASSMARENGSLRKDLDKTKTKLKDTESKLKNVIQEKTKLEGEKASAEREIKLLHGQKSLLERETNKRESLAGKRRESSVDRSSTVLNPKKGRGYAIPFETVQEDYKDLEVLAFEMEATIASLEEQLAAAQGEKEVAINSNESFSLELESLLGKLNTFESELFAKQEEVSSLSCQLEESNSYHRKSENLMNMLVDEKEEMAMQLANALLEMEEEKAIWSTKEKGRMEAMEEKAKSYNAEVLSLTNRLLEMSEAKDEVDELSSLISSMEVKAQKDERNNKNEMAKVRMRLHWTDKKLKAITERHRERVTEGDLMHKKFEEASAKLKEKLSATLDKNLKLRKQIVANK